MQTVEVRVADDGMVRRADDVPFEAYTVGTVITSPARRILEADVHALASFTNDSRGLWAAAPGAPLPVPPLQVFSVAVCMLLHGGPLPYIPRDFVAFLGFDEIEFIDDIAVGDVIQSRVTVEALEEKRTTGVIRYRHEVVDDRGETLIRSRQAILVKRAVQDA